MLSSSSFQSNIILFNIKISFYSLLPLGENPQVVTFLSISLFLPKEHENTLFDFWLMKRLFMHGDLLFHDQWKLFSQRRNEMILQGNKRASWFLCQLASNFEGMAHDILRL